MSRSPKFVRASGGSQVPVQDVKFTLYLTLGLVVLVIFLLLRNFSATVIPSLALPMSLVGTFAVMALLGYSLYNLSLMALTLAVGFVVDDAIVMLENIVRHMERGERPMEAAFQGSSEIGFTIVSMTISLVAVFIPLLFLGGLIGRLFREFAVTISAAILVSAEELEARRAELEQTGGFAYPESQTPWQEIQRGLVDELSNGMVLKPAVAYQRIAETKGVPRHNHSGRG